MLFHCDSDITCVCVFREDTLVWGLCVLGDMWACCGVYLDL